MLDFMVMQMSRVNREKRYCMYMYNTMFATIKINDWD